ncbi:universal stress protein [Wohlfahrtiimonas larvae]|uniref:Universal stress protein n=1 Tax=Wohlfahrtiimonas larvae TaxID=1157986 RepID=A0ABP9MD55_9GAMM|nr:universal stress protein [Wohlfahrtiimonas larvae]
MSNEYKHVLVAIDHSDDSEKIVKQAIVVAQRNHAKITLLHVIEDINIALGYELMPIISEQTDTEIVSEAKRHARALADRLGIPDADTHVVSAFSTKEGIIKTSESLKVELVVVGAHTRQGLALLLGSTSGSIINDSPCDVLVVKV